MFNNKKLGVPAPVKRGESEKHMNEIHKEEYLKRKAALQILRNELTEIEKNEPARRAQSEKQQAAAKQQLALMKLEAAVQRPQ